MKTFIFVHKSNNARSRLYSEEEALDVRSRGLYHSSNYDLFEIVPRKIREVIKMEIV